jgi:5-methylcytosine-specific restriction endonuclease McrA
VSAGWKWPPGWRAIRRQVFAAKGRQCWWCGAPATTVDHYPIAASQGGPHELWNLIPSCARDNYSRGAALGNQMRPARPLTAAQKRAIALKRRTGRTAGGPSARPEPATWRTARRW